MPRLSASPGLLAINLIVVLPFVTASGEVSRGEKMLYSGTDPESYITEITLVYEEQTRLWSSRESL